MGVMTPGKIHPSRESLYVSYGGYEHSYKHNYEILVSRGPTEWLSATKGTDFFYVWNFLQKSPQKMFFIIITYLQRISFAA